MFKKSIRNKLIALLLLTTIVPFGTSIAVTYYHIKASLRDQIVQENRNLLYQGKVNLESYISELSGLSLTLYNNPNFLNFLKSANNNYTAMDTVKDILQTILHTEENIERVYISFAQDDRIVSISKQSAVVFSTRSQDVNFEAFEKAKNSPSKLYIEPIHFQNEVDTVINVKRPKPVVSIHRSFINTPSDEVLAYISLEFTPDKIFELSKNLYNKENEEFYIITPEGNLIYRSSLNTLPNEKKQEWIGPLVNTNEEQGAMEWKDAFFDGVMIYNKLPQPAGGWMLVKRIPYATLYQSVFRVAIINIMFGVIGLILVVLATLFVSFKITSPIRVLLQNIHQVEKGNMQVEFQSLGTDEIGILGDRFKQMIEKINHLINKEYKLELENKTNQLRVLQSQINPHFLYNALQSIGTVALKNNVPQIYSLITHLSKIMRYGMNMEEDKVPLLKEINYMKAFLLLQKERFGDQFEYVFDIEEKALNVAIPKMIIQPIIENYFKHGFESRVGIGKLLLACRLEKGEVVIEVLDNGVGISEERLQEIYSHFDNHSTLREGTNIGLKNVYARLKLYYNDQATLQLQNVEEGGLLVTMRLPISEEGVHDEGNHS
ncbi:cache domain-containing sensor histidine kinase [Fredinandcohnia humi]